MRPTHSTEKGFTLIELLVVIIIIGILSAIALPSFLNQANKAKQSEAKQNVGSLNRAQQAYYLENSEWGTDVDVLGLGIQTQTTNYRYSIVSYGDTQAINTQGLSLKPALRSYSGRVELGSIAETSEATTLAVLCETTGVGSVSSVTQPSAISGSDPVTACGAALKPVDTK